MSTNAGKLARIWSLKLRMGRLSDTGQRFAKALLARLAELDADEPIRIDAAPGRRPFARFIRDSTGEVLAELDADSAPRG